MERIMHNSSEKANDQSSVGASGPLTERSPSNLASRADDPFFANISTYSGDAPSDLSINHDEYLYGDLA